ncbi:MAG: prolipoprotein diacylglyceryl transferase [Planctomycetota bacterium]
MAELPFPAWDPVLLNLGFLQIRWYSLMYVVGFVAGHMILSRLAKARFFPLAQERVADLIFWLVLGVILGGRVGYCLFYRPELLATWQVIAVWEGGLSFHGGLLGVVIAAVAFSYKHRVSGWRVLDSLALAVTPGIFAVRLANFINGELYGRICSTMDPFQASAAPPWAMRFPTDPVALQQLGIPVGAGIREREAQMREAFGTGQWEQIQLQVPLRHPSQIYEAIGEGLIAGLVLLIVYRLTRHRPLGSGVYGGLFALLYGGSRFVVEYFRQPDAQFRDPDAGDHLGTVLMGFTMGQVLCAAMIAYGLLAVGLRWRKRDGLREDPAPAPPAQA